MGTKNNKTPSLTGEVVKAIRLYPVESLLFLVGTIISSMGQVVTIGSLLPVLTVLLSEGGQFDETVGGRASQMVGVVLKGLGLEGTLGALLMVFLLVALVCSLLGWLTDTYQAVYLRKMEDDVRFDLVNSVLSAEWGYLCKLGHGEFINAATQQAESHKTVIKYGFLVLASCVQGLVLICFALFIDFRLTLIGVGVCVVSAVFYGPVFRLSYKTGQRWAHAFDALHVSLLNILRSMKVIKASSLESYASKQLTIPIQSVSKAYMHQGVISSCLVRMSEVIAFMIISAMVYSGRFLLKMGINELFIVLIVFFRVVPNVRQIFSSYQCGRSVIASSEMVRKQIEEAQRARQGTGTLKAPAEWKRLEFRNVSFGYNGGDGLLYKNLSFDISPREFWGIVGPTGYGKTSLLDLVLGLTNPVFGEIYVDDVRLQDYDIASWHGQIGYLNQDPVVFAGTVRSNLLWGVESGQNGVDASRLLEVLDLAQFRKEQHSADSSILDLEVAESGNNLSGGEKQRLAFARVLLRSPSLLVLDEPSSALDAKTEKNLWEVLFNLRGKITLVMVTHKEDFLEYCDRVVRFGDGGVEIV